VIDGGNVPRFVSNIDLAAAGIVIGESPLRKESVRSV
jgi:hypothetical protein